MPLYNIGLENLKSILNLIGEVLKIIGILIAGIWAYFKFIRYRVLKPRLEFECDYTKSSSLNNSQLIILKLKVRNVGQVNVELPSGDKHLIFGLFKHNEIENEIVKFPILEEDIQRFEIFSEHKWIEPGETIVDSIPLTVLANEKDLALQIVLKIFSRVTWTSSWIFPLVK